MLAGTLYHLGVFLGDNAPAPTFEDLELFEAYDNGDWTKFNETVSKYNHLHRIWGFKLPSTVSSLEKLHEIIRNPYYVFVFRDFAAIAMRSRISHNMDLLESMKDAANNYVEILNFISKCSPNGIICSYDKILLYKHDFIESINNTFNFEITDAQRSNALGFITREPIDYLRETCFSGYLGYLDSIEDRYISGWAKHEDSNRNAQLEIRLNNKKIGVILASCYREDIKRKAIHPTGNCGFSYRFPSSHSLKNGDEISVRFASNGIELRNSPLIVSI